MPGFTLRVKTKTGQVLVEVLTSNSTILELLQHLSSVTNIPASRISLLAGYPPKILNIPDGNMTLGEFNIKTGDTLIIQEKDVLRTPNAFFLHDLQEISDGGPLMRKVVPADNSCLFTSIGFVLGAGRIDTTSGNFMRQIIVQEVSKDEDNYSAAILGKPNKEYCEWILKPESWGGGIELAVLSKFYGIEIAVVDTRNALINRFGEDKNYKYRVFLIFDGIHYDPLYKETLKGDDSIETIFNASNEKVLKEAEELAEEAKSSKQFTDVNNFILQCLVCRQELTGQRAAQQHAQSTGHLNFGEVSS